MSTDTTTTDIFTTHTAPGGGTVDLAPVNRGTTAAG